MRVTLQEFLEWEPTGGFVRGRQIRYDSGWGEGVWWSAEFNGVVSPIAAQVKVLGYEDNPPDWRVDSPIHALNSLEPELWE